MSERQDGARVARVFLVFYGGDWRGHQVEMMGLVGQYAPVIPRVGEVIQGPDDFGLFRVEDVTYNFVNGIARPPKVYVLCRKPPAESPPEGEKP